MIKKSYTQRDMKYNHLFGDIKQLLSKMMAEYVLQLRNANSEASIGLFEAVLWARV